MSPIMSPIMSPKYDTKWRHDVENAGDMMYNISINGGHIMNNIKDFISESYFENKEYEYKLSLESQEERIEKWAKTLVGFSNEIGGTMLVGVNNDGLVIGLTKDDVDKTKNLVLKTIDRHIFPHIEVKFDVFEFDTKYVLAIKVDYTNNIIIYKTCYFNEKVYIIEDGATVPATVNQILKLGKRRFGVDNTLLDKIYKKTEFSKFLQLSIFFYTNYAFFY